MKDMVVKRVNKAQDKTNCYKKLTNMALPALLAIVHKSSERYNVGWCCW